MSATTRPKPKTEQPETPSQARRHDGLVLRYRRAGLCIRCASQAAWAVFCGWSTVHPPCRPCARRMSAEAGFTKPKLNGWVALPGREVGFGAGEDTRTPHPAPQIASTTALVMAA